MWCVAELDEEYIARMEDVLAWYEKPLSEEEPVVCIDEKPVVLHADLRPPRPMYPGRTLRRDSEYERRGTANAFCGVEPKAGRYYPRVTPDRSSPEFADYLLEIAEHYPGSQYHPFGDGQSELPHPPGRGGAVWPEGGRLAVGPVHRPLHAEPRQLAQSGRDRNQPLLTAVFGTAKNPVAGRSGARNQGLGAENEP